MITKTDTEFVVNNTTYTARVLTEDGRFIRGELFVSGFRKSTYRTQAGLDRTINKIKNSKQATQAPIV